MMSPRRRANSALRPVPPSAYFVLQIIRPLLAHIRLPVLVCLQSHLGRNLSKLGHSRQRVNLKSRKRQVAGARWKQREQKAIGRRCSGQIHISLGGRPPGPPGPPLTQWKKNCVFSQTTRTIILRMSLCCEDVREASRRLHQPSIRLPHYLLPSRPSSRRACMELRRFRRPRLIFLLRSLTRARQKLPFQSFRASVLLLGLLLLEHPHHRRLARFRILLVKLESLLLEPALLRRWCRA